MVGGYVTAALAATVCLCAAPAALAQTAPGAPRLVAPSSGQTLSANAPQTFTIEASDPDGDPYSGWVTVTDSARNQVAATFPTSPAPSGQSSSGTPLDPLPPGSYTWTATASDVFGNTSAPASPQAFSVGGSPDLGGGAFDGTVTYSPSLPGIGQACRATSFSVTATSAMAIVSFAPSQFAGFVNLSGAGASACENFLTGTGTLTLAADGLGATATTLSCAQLTGQYSRVGSQLTAVVSGPCKINSATDAVSLDIEAELVPADYLTALTSPIPYATLDGGFLVSPAG